MSCGVQGETHPCVYLRGGEGWTGARQSLVPEMHSLCAGEKSLALWDQTSRTKTLKALNAYLQVPLPQRLGTAGLPVRRCRIRPSGLILCLSGTSALAAS